MLAGYPDLMTRLKLAVLAPLRNPERFERLGISPPRGILLYGPPGTGKTSLALAAGSEAGRSLLVAQVRASC